MIRIQRRQPRHLLMNSLQLANTASFLVGDDKGLLAMDESTRTCDRRFAELGISQSTEARREYRELILTAPGLAESISGVILYDETIRQTTKDGVPFLEVIRKAGLLPGIKVDAGTVELAGHPGEKVTEGLDGLREKLVEYARLGARFAKWRCILVLNEDRPSHGAILANAHTLARYAALCQEVGILPIVEPEVLMEGTNSLQQSAEVTEEVLLTVFQELHVQGVDLEGMILKPNMVLSGLTSQIKDSVDDVASATIKCLLRAVPAAVPGIAFLSGGQLGERDSEFLNAMNAKYRSIAPWALTFSFGRAIQNPALEIWGGKAANVEAAQRALVHRAACDRAARRGEYTTAMEGKP